MAKLTNQGVCYDLTDTPYMVEHNGIIWHFSSVPHRNKFRREVCKRELWLNDSLTKRFGCTMMLDLVADIQLYKQVETRGFYLVTNDGAEYTSPESIVIAPNEMIIGIVPNSNTLASMLGGGMIG